MLRATTVQPGAIAIESYADPVPGPGEILVRVERVGICGSDLHIFGGHHPTATFPRVQGHEASARVESLPDGYAGFLSAGDRVAVDPLITCGECYACRIGRSNCCPNLRVIGAHVDGFLQELIAVPHSNVYPVAALSADDVILCEPVSVGLQAVVRAGIEAGEHVLIIGAGPIGACTAIAAIDRGARVMMVDTVQERLDAALRFGADAIALANAPHLDDTIRDWSGPDGPPVTIDAVGHPSVIQQCCRLVAPAGRVVIVGLSDQQVSLPIVDFTYKEMTILGSRASARLFPEAIALVERHRSRLAGLISHRFSLADVQPAIEQAIADPVHTMKVIIDLDPPPA